ncbi:uncharacterized protein [Dysidea avara]|uniref:uncharacterized protein n=1 Tax=Dysidea avara TaxID=196820 RepID=UPI00332E660D
MDEIRQVGPQVDDVITIPLKTLKLRGACYESKSSNDITLEYDRKSHNCVQLNVEIEGQHGEPKGTFSLNRISGETLFLHTVNGSLDDMVVKLLLETTSKVEVASNDKVEHIRCGMIVVTADVKETGNIREVLMGLPSKSLMQANSKLKLQEGIPQWSSHLPWWLYSKRLRTFIQQLLILHTIFNTIWALWQLYRHVDFIQAYLEPYIILLQEICHVYLSVVMDFADDALEIFTDLWWKFLSPFKVLLGPLITPLYNSLWYLAPLLYKLVSPIVGLVNSAIYLVTLTGWLIWYLATTLLRPILLLITTIVRPIVWLFWVIVMYVIRPLFDVIQRILGLTKGGIDPVKALVKTVLLNGFKSVYNLLKWTTWFGKTYHHKHHKSNEEHKKHHGSNEEHKPSLRKRNTTLF